MRQTKIEVQSAMTKNYNENAISGQIQLVSTTISAADEIMTSTTVRRCKPFITQA